VLNSHPTRIASGSIVNNLAVIKHCDADVAPAYFVDPSKLGLCKQVSVAQGAWATFGVVNQTSAGAAGLA
jgi:hypothetical protein